jgi:predicted RNA-binding Zn ribbon-like protein
VKESEQYKFSQIGGVLCLDFTNTASWHASYRSTEHLNDFCDLLRWSNEYGIIGPDTKLALSEGAERNPAGALTILTRARKLREGLYRIFVAVSQRKSPGRPDMQLLNETLDQAPVRFEVQHEESGFSGKRMTGGSEFATVLGPVAWSAAELLTSENLHRIKRCADDTCGWLFLDNTKNRSRRWCDMGDCGSRAKAKRYYRRKTKK